MTIRHVKQQHRGGCGPACLAMLTGMSYWGAVKFGKRYGVTTHGTSRIALDRALAAAGFALQRFPGRRHAWAPAHLVEVQWAPGDRRARAEGGRGSWHFVVMLDDGTIYDPVLEPDTPIRLDFYASVDCVAGVFEVVSPYREKSA